jgi:hypothetical protein
VEARQETRKTRALNLSAQEQDRLHEKQHEHVRNHLEPKLSEQETKLVLSGESEHRGLTRQKLGPGKVVLMNENMVSQTRIAETCMIAKNSSKKFV